MQLTKPYDAKKPMVSIVLPCYNGAAFVTHTVSSVLEQTYSCIELIVVNDGSTDESEKKILNFASDTRLIYHYQENKGVSVARNKGMEMAGGDYILFLDADDILINTTIEQMVDFLLIRAEFGFVTTKAIEIDRNGDRNPANNWRGVTDNILEDILSYNKAVTTCPSAYLFRLAVLKHNNLRFDEQLSSTADRFFLQQIAGHTKGELLGGSPGLLYRVHEGNMSGKITNALIQDNLLYRHKTLAMTSIPSGLRNHFIYKTNYIFAGCYYKTGRPLLFLKYLFLALIKNPGKLIKHLLSKKN
ncbi:MAG TPA: glycosyltransferase family A protein [Flavobacteriales bacterium]|nr:glycosyltransferase family A protein [Flavobacteriales bacterium]